MHASVVRNNHRVCGPEVRKNWLKEINSIMDLYLSWIAQLVRALVHKAKGLGSTSGPGYNFSLQILNLANRWPSSEN